MLREEFDDWAVLFDPDTGHGFGLSPTGVYVWKLLDGERSIDDIVKDLRQDADDVTAEAGEHLVAFVEELTEHGLVAYEREEAHEERERTSPCPTCCGAMQCKYEPPKLIDLRGSHAAHGANCPSGSEAGGTCGTIGNSAGGQCTVNGVHATTLCGFGPADAFRCQMGNGNATDCQAGNTASLTCSGGGFT